MVSARRIGKIFKVEVKINQEDSAAVMTNLVFSIGIMGFVAEGRWNSLSVNLFMKKTKVNEPCLGEEVWGFAIYF
jgi:hypothetical protein